MVRFFDNFVVAYLLGHPGAPCIYFVICADFSSVL